MWWNANLWENGKTIYKPIPRDRDQAFSIMGDGTLLNAATSIIPALRLMKSYNEIQSSLVEEVLKIASKQQLI